MQGLLKIQSELLRYVDILVYGFIIFVDSVVTKNVKSLNCHLQWMLQIPGATSYMGCIGKDKYGEEMKKNAKDAGVKVRIL